MTDDDARIAGDGGLDLRGTIQEKAEECDWSEATLLDLVLDFFEERAAREAGLARGLVAHLRGVRDEEVASGEEP